jgi:hypothetical protein
MPMAPRMNTQRGLHVGSCVLSVVGALLGGCASSGTEPHAMTAGQHQAAAQVEEKSAAQHQAQHDPSLTRAAGPATCVEYESADCYVRWKSTENPTEGHVRDARKHRKLAEKHRAASQVLRDAEQRFCSGIPAADRDQSPFYHREDINAAQGLKKMASGHGHAPGAGVVQVQEIEKQQALGVEVDAPGGLQGARITFRAMPGMTGEWLQRVVDCHLARNAVVGSDPAMSFCPLAVPRATASVISSGGGFAVDISSDSAGSVREIIKRAAALGPGGPPITK